MNYRKFSKKELVDVLEVIQSSAECRTQEDMQGLLESLRRLVSGDYAICGIGKGTTKKGLYSPPMIINGNYPGDWLNIYASEELYYTDPLILRNFHNPGTQLWEDTYSIYRDQLTPEFLSSRDFGLNYGVSGGLYQETTQTSSLLSFSGEGKWYGRHQLEILSLVSPHVHQALTRVFRFARRPSGGELSSREREIINWIKEGKTNWEISVILEISERTVKFHVQNIERKLDAVNKAHAVAIALEQEQLL